MNFGFTEEQLELQEMVREFVAKEITPIAGEMDAENATRPELFKMAADMGLLNVIVPEEYGGLGLDSVTVAMPAWRLPWLPTPWQRLPCCWQAMTNRNACGVIS